MPWTVVLLGSLSVGFSRQEYWSGLPCPPPGSVTVPEPFSHVGFYTLLRIINSKYIELMYVLSLESRQIWMIMMVAIGDSLRGTKAKRENKISASRHI